MSVSNPYEQHIYNTMERIILAEDVKFSEVKDIEGKFYVKVMTPTVDTTDLSTRNVKGYSSKNYITLKIPAYLLWSFMFPKVSKVSLGKGDGSQILMTFNTTNFNKMHCMFFRYSSLIF